MWQGAITGIALGHLERVACCMVVRSDAAACQDVRAYVLTVLMLQPWYFRIPLEFYAWCVGACCVLITARPLHTLTPVRRSAFLARAQRFPYFSMLDAFIASAALLRAFDHQSFRATLPHVGI